jgi:proteasomal ATPase-associated factor 1
VLPPKAILRSPEKSSVVKVCPTSVLLTPRAATDKAEQAITAFDVAPDGLLVATGYLDGSVHVHNPSAPPTSAQLQRARPHLSSVNALRFFPSSRVLLTAGNDFTLCILPADPAPADASAPPAALSPVRTLRAHKRAVTDAAILGRGQNVLSAAKDGTVRLWDVAAGAQIRALAAAGYAPVLALAAGPRAAAAFVPAADGGVAPAAPAGTAEVGTADMLAFGALGDGTFEAFDVAAGHAVFRSPDRGAALTAIDYSPARNLVATGAADGAVRVWDTRMLDAPVTSFTRGTAGIEGIAFVDVLPTAAGSADASEAGLVVTTVDGLPYVANVRAERPPRVVAELVGADCDRVGIVRVRGHGAWGAAAENTSELWLAADDGVLRTY